MNLSDIREHITTIDAELLALIERRMTLSIAVADYKLEHQLPIFDPIREQAVLEKIPKVYQPIWKDIMQISKDQ